MSKSFERDPFDGNIEPVTKRGTRLAEGTRAIIASLNESEPFVWPTVETTDDGEDDE